MAESTIVKKCSNCEQNNITHEFQDTQYGKFMRVFNISEKGGENCTICNNGKKVKK